MQQEDKIWKELGQISPLVAGISRKGDLLSVPDGYFDSFADRLSLSLQQTEMGGARALGGGTGKISTENVLTPPVGYFDAFPDRLLGRLRAAAEASAPAETRQISALLGSITRQVPFTLPPDYFDHFSSYITSLAASSGGRDVLPVCLEGLHQQPSYQVPAGYFDAFGEKLLGKLPLARKAAKILVLGYNKPWLRVAAAAALTGILVTIGFFTLTRQQAAGTDPATAMTRLSDQEIVNYIETQDIPLAEATGNGAAVAPAPVELNETDMKEMFHEVPDQDLRDYINERNGTKDLKTD